jgi:type II secretory pathway pseudopilin PulG
MELMIVVLLVAVLAALAAPAMSEARNDRITFDYARQYQQLLVQARSRAAGTGAAHLAVLRSYNGNPRGWIRLYAALDGVLPAPPVGGPNPVSSCKANNQWTQALQDPILLNGTTARFIDYADLTRAGVNDTMDVRADLFAGTGALNAASAPVAYIVVCITPSGVTYVGSGADALTALAMMRAASPFTGVAEVRIQRHSAGTGIGLRRRVMITGGGAPRLRSE